jgi:hypothetical protein
MLRSRPTLADSWGFVTNKTCCPEIRANGQTESPLFVAKPLRGVSHLAQACTESCLDSLKSCQWALDSLDSLQQEAEETPWHTVCHIENCKENCNFKEESKPCHGHTHYGDQTHKITQEYNLDGGIQATTTDGKVQEQAQFRSRK